MSYSLSNTAKIWLGTGIAILAVVGILVLVWFSTGTPEDSSTAPTSEDTSPAPEAEAEESSWANDEPMEVASEDPLSEETPSMDDEGHVMKDLGEDAGLVDDNDQEVFAFTITDVEILDSCPARVGTDELYPEHEVFLAVQVEARLSTNVQDYFDDNTEDTFMPLVADAFSVTGSNDQDIS